MYYKYVCWVEGLDVTFQVLKPKFAFSSRDHCRQDAVFGKIAGWWERTLLLKDSYLQYVFNAERGFWVGYMRSIQRVCPTIF